MKTKTSGSILVDKALKKLGDDIRNGRKRRGVDTRLFSERIGVSKPTLARLERGDASVSIGSYARALNELGKLKEFTEIADIAHDRLGQLLEDQALPVRVRKKRSVK